MVLGDMILVARIRQLPTVRKENAKTWWERETLADFSVGLSSQHHALKSVLLVPENIEPKRKWRLY